MGNRATAIANSPFKKGTPKPDGSGRKKGAPNKTTTSLKQAILLAATNVGLDGLGKEGLVGYLMRLAVSEPSSFASLLGRVIPLEVTGAGGKSVPVVITVETTLREVASLYSQSVRDSNLEMSIEEKREVLDLVAIPSPSSDEKEDA